MVEGVRGRVKGKVDGEKASRRGEVCGEGEGRGREGEG